MPKNETARRPPGPGSNWPDLRHKHRPLAIPAVVAAIVADKGCRLPPEQRKAESSRRSDGKT